jgi:hypothetical protein
MGILPPNDQQKARGFPLGFSGPSEADGRHSRVFGGDLLLAWIEVS